MVFRSLDNFLKENNKESLSNADKPSISSLSIDLSEPSYQNAAKRDILQPVPGSRSVGTIEKAGGRRAASVTSATPARFFRSSRLTESLEQARYLMIVLELY